MNNKLAIIIPAYKNEYLDKCLNSIANQTNKNFKLYIGNDGSLSDIDSIIDKYKERIDLKYKRFPENIGGSSLVKHWARCIDMIDNESWIWLFSDDDMMDADCVESFYKTYETNQNTDVFRFNLQVVNAAGAIERITIYPEQELPGNFLLNRFALKYDSAITNYIFSRNAYDLYGFKEFPLGWCSDDASIVNFTDKKPIITIPKSNVQWRISEGNISAVKNSAIQKQKVYSRLEYIKWLYASNNFPQLNLNSNKDIVLKWMISSINKEFIGLNLRKKKLLFRETEIIIGKNINVYRFKTYCFKMRNRARLLAKSFNRRIIRMWE